MAKPRNRAPRQTTEAGSKLVSKALKDADVFRTGKGGTGGSGDLPKVPRTGVKGMIKEAGLPTTGRIRYVPPKGVTPTTGLPRGPKGYYDRHGNEWVKGPSRTKGEPYEWDVQLSSKGRNQIGWATRDGSHANVSLGGHITHK